MDTPSATIREKYEWSNNWWNNADDPTLPRVLLIGDSISCGYGPVVIERLKDIVNVDRMANSRGVHDAILFKEIQIALEDCRYRVFHFNNGLHADHLTDEEYARHLDRYVRHLRQFAGDARMVWASSTPVTQPAEGFVPDDVRNPQVIRRNAVAARIMAEHGIPTNDLYSLVLGRGELRVPDGYHYNESGYQVLGNQVADVLRQMLASPSETSPRR